MKDYIDKEGLKTIGKYINQKDKELATSIGEVQAEVITKQDILVSGTNIKTINGDAILGSGDLEIDIEPEEATELEIRRLFRTEYSITTSITNGTYSGDTSIWTEETAAVTLAANTGYNLPDEIAVSGASYVYTKGSGLVALANAEGNVTISAECFRVPNIGDIIKLNGESDRYRVLKVNGNIAQLMRLGAYDSFKFSVDGTTKIFDNGSTGIEYENSVVDTHLNTTYYNTLSTTVKNAIVPENRIQNMYSRVTDSLADADFRIQKSDGTWYSYTKTDQTTVGQRNIYALDISDIVEYLGTDFSGTDLLNMFFEQTTTSSRNLWTSSAHASNSSYAFYFNGNGGPLSGTPYNTRNEALPAFSIDLSQVSWVAE